MVHAHDALGVLQGLLVLALLWWTWCAYAWLGNQARADTGIVRVAMAVAMAALFVVALTIPEAWDDAEGGLDGPLALVGDYLIVQCVHLSVYALAARGDPGLRRQLVISWGPTVAGAVLLVTGVLLGGQLQTVFFAGALVVDWGGIYLTSREGNWRIHSAPHWTERHGLFIILAVGESVVAIGVAAAGQPISTPLLAAGVLGIATALCLWWLYFDVVSRAAEHRLRDAQGQARVRMAIEAYTYGHFPGTSRSSPASSSAQSASRTCSRMPGTASRWASSTPRPCMGVCTLPRRVPSLQASDVLSTQRAAARHGRRPAPRTPGGGVVATARRAGWAGAPSWCPDRPRDEALRGAQSRRPPRLSWTRSHTLR
jgi:Bacterial low temperature requirement A protein (LtrA)